MWKKKDGTAGPLQYALLALLALATAVVVYMAFSRNGLGLPLLPDHEAIPAR